MGILDMFSSGTVDKAIDVLATTGDKLAYTEEEKADFRMKLRELKIEGVKAMGQYRLAQRYIAIMFTINFILSFWVGTAIWYFSTEEKLAEYIKLADVYQLGWIMVAIISWYFTDGAMSWVKKRIK